MRDNIDDGIKPSHTNVSGYRENELPVKGVSKQLFYASYALAAIIVIAIILCILCKCVRDACWHCLCCCCCPCCSYDKEIPSTSYDLVEDEEEMPPTHHPPPPPLPPSFPTSLPQQASQPPMQPPQPPLALPHSNGIKMSPKPLRMNTYFYKRPIPVASYNSPGIAPPAAKQVARTAKIIGNILAYDRGKRKR